VIVWVRLSRWREWAHSKVPFTAAAALLLGFSPERTLLVLLTVVLWAAFGYGINEIADRTHDARAGRTSRATALGRAPLAAFLLGTAVLAVGSSLLWSEGLAVPVVVAAGLALAVAYSVPPVRLKERGAAGVVAGGAAQWTAPILVLAIASPGAEGASLVALSVALGIRWLLVHQLQDAAADRRAQVRTFVSGKADVGSLLPGIFALELALLVVVLAVAWPRSASATAALAGWVLVSELVWPRERQLRERLTSYDDAPLAAYYFCLLPASLAFQNFAPTSVVLGLLVVALGSPSLVGSARGSRPRSRRPASARS
jgi:4-hydroxybenzoate polyprenyltransferase